MGTYVDSRGEYEQKEIHKLPCYIIFKRRVLSQNDISLCKIMSQLDSKILTLGLVHFSLEKINDT